MERKTPEIGETQLMARARELQLEIPADQKLNILKGANHLQRLAGLVRDFAYSKDLKVQ